MTPPSMTRLISPSTRSRASRSSHLHVGPAVGAVGEAVFDQVVKDDLLAGLGAEVDVVAEFGDRLRVALVDRELEGLLADVVAAEDRLDFLLRRLGSAP